MEENAAKIMEQMRRRFSCRSFSERAVEDELLTEILDTGLSAASGGNLQPWSVIVVRSGETKALLARQCGQEFIARAAVDLVFLLDWSKLKRYAEGQMAPFVAHQAFHHNLIAFADVMCAAQTMETAAQLAGLGCCFIGNLQGHAGALRPALKFPLHSYPVLALCLGYPSARREPRAAKLSREAMVYDEVYAKDAERSERAFAEKYAGMEARLPSKEPYRSRQLAQIRQALLTTWPEETTEAALSEIEGRGAMNEMQRRFCLHYRAHEARQSSERLRVDMDLLGIQF